MSYTSKLTWPVFNLKLWSDLTMLTVFTHIGTVYNTAYLDTRDPLFFQLLYSSLLGHIKTVILSGHVIVPVGPLLCFEQHCGMGQHHWKVGESGRNPE